MKLLTVTIKPYKLDQLMVELLDVDTFEVRVFEYKSYAADNSHTEVFRGQERKISLVPKTQIQILADPDNLVKADEIIKKYRDNEGGAKDIAFVSDVTLV